MEQNERSRTPDNEPLSSVLDCSPSVHVSQDETVLKMARRLHELGNELQLDLFERFELFLRIGEDVKNRLEGETVAQGSCGVVPSRKRGGASQEEEEAGYGKVRICESPIKEKEDKTLKDVTVGTICPKETDDMVSSEHKEMMSEPVAMETKLGVTMDNDDDEKELGLVDADSVELFQIDFSESPTLLTSAQDDFLRYKGNNFLKGCKWSPDGTCILTNSDDGTLRLFNLPTELYCPRSWSRCPNLQAVLQMVEGELIYDYCWYPGMTSFQAETCCFASTSRGHPVHMWDAFDGKLRCSYRPHNHMDDLITPHSLGFSVDGSKLYCGFNKLIKVFDTTRPGKDCQTRYTKGKLGGQTGIISCFAMDPDGSMFAAGSYSKTIGLYTDSCPSPVSILSGQTNGVTHLVFSQDGSKIYSGGRKDNNILCWDVRRSSEVLFCVKRNITTNQRMYFDIDREDRYLLSGNQDGNVTVWDLSRDGTTSENSPLLVLDSMMQFEAHEDATNGISLHPSLPLLATASGQRSILQPSVSDGESDEETDQGKQEKIFHNSLRIWSLYENKK